MHCEEVRLNHQFHDKFVRFPDIIKHADVFHLWSNYLKWIRNNSNRETKSLKLTKTEKSTSNIDGIFCVEQIIDDNNTSARVYAPFPFLFETFDDAELRKERLNDVWDETNKIKAITRARVITEVLQS